MEIRLCWDYVTDMRMADLDCFLVAVEERKASVGLDESASAVEARRNTGARRSVAKRDALRRADLRAAAVGRPRVLSYY